MTHKQKIKLARALMSDYEKRHHTSIFDSKNWRIRADAKYKKQLKKPTKKPVK